MNTDMMQKAFYETVDKAKRYDQLIKIQGFNELQCSFCGAGQSKVKKLIAGRSVYICDECVELCYEIISEDQNATKDSGKNG